MMTEDSVYAIAGFLSLLGGVVVALARWEWQWSVYGLLALFAFATVATFRDKRSRR